MTPQVSILLPAFDAESTLATCLRSIERQTETRFECLLVDDGSRDRTLGVARSFARRDRRFVVVECQHRGLVATLNAGRIGQRIHGAQVIPPEALTRVRRCPIVVSVAGQSARSQIRGALSEMGFRERVDFVCAA